jgi:hypothetical protein
MLLKILNFALHTSPLSVPGCKADHAYLTYLILHTMAALSLEWL